MTSTSVACALAGAVAVVSAQAVVSRPEGDSMERKLQTITERGTIPATQSAPLSRTTFTDRELNSYLAYNALSKLPVGLREPRITIPAANRFDARAVVDLDEVRKSKDYGILGLVLQGTHEIKLSGTFSGANGKGTVHVTAATLDGVSVPENLIEALVNHFSKTPDIPGGFQLDKPFDLPSKIRTLQLQPGSVTIVQ